MLIPFSTTQLMKIASVGAVFVIGNGLLMRSLTHKRFKQSSYFVQARDAVIANRAVVDLLGEPVEFGNVDLDDRLKNYCSTSEAKFEISMKGTKTNGILYLSAVRNTDDTKDKKFETSGGNSSAEWVLKSLEITVQNKPNQKLILLRDQTEC